MASMTIWKSTTAWAARFSSTKRPWGLLTLDALDPEQFEPIELDALEAFASLAAATVNAAERIERLNNRVEDEHQRAEVYRQASGQQNREMIGQSKALKNWWKKSIWSAAAT
jgi:anaerobic nitric oxide reductase transcription regulator